MRRAPEAETPSAARERGACFLRVSRCAPLCLQCLHRCDFSRELQLRLPHKLQFQPISPSSSRSSLGSRPSISSVAMRRVLVGPRR